MTPQPPPAVDTDTTLQEQVEEQAEQQKYGTFAGVFTPTLLTILGVIMYLRQGAVVGNAGLGGAWLVIGLVCGIVACTALSLSSITTNIRIGAGGRRAVSRPPHSSSQLPRPPCPRALLHRVLSAFGWMESVGVTCPPTLGGFQATAAHCGLPARGGARRGNRQRGRNLRL